MNDRLSPRVPAKRNATHSTPGPTSVAFTILRLMEKIKIRITSTEKTNMVLKSSRVLSSVTRSFQTMAAT